MGYIMYIGEVFLGVRRCEAFASVERDYERCVIDGALGESIGLRTRMSMTIKSYYCHAARALRKLVVALIYAGKHPRKTCPLVRACHCLVM